MVESKITTKASQASSSRASQWTLNLELVEPSGLRGQEGAPVDISQDLRSQEAVA